MRRHWYGSAVWLAGLAVLAGAALVACSSSSTPASSPTAGAATTSAATSASGGGSATVSTGATAASAPTTASSGGSRPLPGDACTLLSEANASQLAGSPVTGHTAPPVKGLYVGGTTEACHYYGSHGTGDHPVNIVVTSFADAGAAQKFMQGQVAVYKLSPGYQSLSGYGDEAFEVHPGPAGQFTARVGSLVLQVNAGNGTYPLAGMPALEGTAKSVVGRL